MNDLIEDLYFTKSFVSYSHGLNKCFGCKYCRAIETDKLNYDILPEEINPIFKSFPVAINLMYGDPLLQVDDTVKKLRRLESVGHTGPVIIITKGDISKFPILETFDLNLHFGLSTFGCDSPYDGNTLKRFIRNLDVISQSNYKYNIEFRPIIRDVNDSDDVFDFVCRTASEYKTSIGYSGLQVNPSLKQYLESQDIHFKPYDGHEFGLKKFISDERDNRLREIAKSYDVPIFRKTSCLIAHTHNLERDPNAHYYRPNEVGCWDCPMRDKCMSYKKSHETKTKLDIEIPFNYELIHDVKYQCGLLKAGLCKFPSNDCLNISGTVIKIDDEITTTDVRAIKWLTGYTVQAKFQELPYLSKNWLKQ